jgi:hypothetical protein
MPWAVSEPAIQCTSDQGPRVRQRGHWIGYYLPSRSKYDTLSAFLMWHRYKTFILFIYEHALHCSTVVRAYHLHIFLYLSNAPFLHQNSHLYSKPMEFPKHSRILPEQSQAGYELFTYWEFSGQEMYDTLRLACCMMEIESESRLEIFAERIQGALAAWWMGNSSIRPRAYCVFSRLNRTVQDRVYAFV